MVICKTKVLHYFCPEEEENSGNFGKLGLGLGKIGFKKRSIGCGFGIIGLGKKCRFRFSSHSASNSRGARNFIFAIDTSFYPFLQNQRMGGTGSF